MISELQSRCRSIRRRIVSLASRSGEGHVPSSLSIVELLVSVLSAIQGNGSSTSSLVLSKGHASLAYYAALEEFGFIKEDELDSFCSFESNFGGHPDSTKHSSITFSTGSLGHGLALAAGAAYYEKNSTNSPRQIFTILGDQECNEGSVWEAALLTSTLKLGNVVTLIDMNGSDSRSIPMANLVDKWRSFNWKVIEVDGHDIGNLGFAIDQTKDHPDSPSALICKTVKGKGVSFMESSFEWHHKKLDQLSLTKALEELQDA